MNVYWRSAAAVVFSLLMVTSLGTPVVASGGVSTTTLAGDSTTAADSSPPILGNLDSTITETNSSNIVADAPLSNETNETLGHAMLSEYRLPAERLWLTEAYLDALESSTNRSNADYEAVADSLNASLEHYPTAYRADDRKAFDRQAEAIHQLARETGGEDDNALDTSSLAILIASNDSAHLAVEEANQSLTLFGDDADDSTFEYAERAIDDAERALERAEKTLEDAPSDSIGQKLQARANVIDHYREATHHADRALEMLGESTDPEFEVFASQPVAVNDSIIVNVVGGVHGPQVSSFDSLEASIEDEPLANSSLQDSSGFGTSVRGTVWLELEVEERENVTVDLRASTTDGEQTLTDSVTINLNAESVRTVRDPDKSYTVEAVDDESGAAVNVTGTGLASGDVSVTDETPLTDDSYRAGPIVRIENRTAIDNAEVSIPFEKDVDPVASNLSIYTWDPESDEHWRPLETEIDADDGVAVTEVDSFSYFSIFSHDEWRGVTRNRVLLEERHLEPVSESVQRDGDPEYTLTVLDSAGTEVGSTTVTDPQELDTYGQHLSFTTIGDYSSDDDHSVVDNIRYQSGTSIENFEERDLDDYRMTRSGGGNVRVVSTPTSDGSAALEMHTGATTTQYTSEEELVALEPGTTLQGDVRHQTDNSGSFAMRTGIKYGTDSQGEGGIHVRLANPGNRVSAGALLRTPNNESQISFTPELGEFYTFRLDVDDQSTPESEFDELEWETNTEADANATIQDDDALDLRVHECGLADATTSLGEQRGDLSISFDYTVDSEAGDQQPVLTINEDGEEIYNSRDDPNAIIDREESDTAEGSASVDVPVDGDIEVSFRLESSSHCSNVDHANTFFDVRNISITAEHHGERSLRDTNGDGIPDVVTEMDLRMPVGEPGVVGRPLDIDPLLLDTSGDGLLDNESVNIEYHILEIGNERYVEATVTNAVANPGQYDTANNGLSDYEELKIWGTNPLLADTSGDGYIDSVDPDPLVDSSPPDVRFGSLTIPYHDYETTFESDLSSLLFVDVRHDEADIESVFVEGQYDPIAFDSPYAQESHGEQLQVTDDGWVQYGVVIHQHGWLNEPPEEYTLYATTEHDGIFDATVERIDGGRMGITEAAVATAVPGSINKPQDLAKEGGKRNPLIYAGAVGLTLIVSANTAEYTSEADLLEEAREDLRDLLSVPVTGTVSELELPEEGVEITIPSGFLESEQGHERGFGEEFISSEIGLTRDELEHAISNSIEIVEENGEIRYIIGPGPTGEPLIITIRDNTVISAIQAQTVEETIEKDAPQEHQDEIGDRTENDDLDETRDHGPYTDRIYRIVTDVGEMAGTWVTRRIGQYVIDGHFEEHDDPEPDESSCLIDESELKMDLEETVTDIELTEFHGTEHGIDLQVDCPHDSEVWVRTTGGMSTENLSALNNSQRGDIAETYAGPLFVVDRDLEVVYLEDPGETGFDIVAYNDSSNEYHIIEAKFRSNSGSVSNSPTWLDRPEKGPQMTNTWIDATIDEMALSGDPALEGLGVELEDAREDGRIQRELIVVQNAEQNEKTVLSTLTEGDMNIDRVHIVKLEKVIS